MKRLLLVVIIILLGVIAYFQYENYKRFTPPSSYSLAISSDIDVNYYDPVILQQYYDNVYALNAFGRERWANEGIDVRYPETDNKSQEAANYYNSTLSITNRLKDLLVYSEKLKKDGFNNDQIKQIIEKGISPENLGILYNDSFIGLAYGDESDEVWEIQKMFIGLGYDIPLDGKFGLETENAVKDYQTKNELYASGEINFRTLKKLLKVL